MESPSPAARIGAEFLGTFWLVFGGCGAAVLAGVVLSPDKVPVGIGYLGVALAFGLTVLTMAFAVGHVSGGHFNPAVTIGLAVARRIEWKWVPTYIVTQVVAASAAGAVLLAVASGKDGFSAAESGFASNGYGDRSPGGYSLLACLIVEVVLTAFFLYVILGATDDRAPKGFAPLAIGLALTLIHLVGIPVTNTSVNPARSLGVAWFAGGDALGQVWLFVLAPIAGAAIAGISYPAITGARGAAAEVDAGVANNP
ncbi:aquaporin Z [Kribbella sp. NPDC003505]|uniref:aquaporin Z n=1 Tax=Kribbella sp. NPDC003505 TaxID=3154448 RepID=UPI0033BBF67F